MKKQKISEKTLAYTKIWMYNYSKIYKNMQGEKAVQSFLAEQKNQEYDEKNRK